MNPEIELCARKRKSHEMSLRAGAFDVTRNEKATTTNKFEVTIVIIVNNHRVIITIFKID